MSAVDKSGRGGEVELSLSSAVAVAVAVSSSVPDDGNTTDVDEATTITSRRANDNNDDDNNDNDDTDNNNNDDMDDEDEDDDDDDEEEEEEGQTATREISAAMEHVFLIMQYRKLQRELNGPQKKRQKYHYGALAICILLVYCFLIGEQYIADDDAAQLQISVDWNWLIGLGVWFLGSVLIISITSDKLLMTVCWVLIYWPLITVLLEILSVNFFHNFAVLFFCIVESLTILIYVGMNVVFPKFLASKYFPGTKSFWKIKAIVNTNANDDDDNDDTNDDNTNDDTELNWTMKYCDPFLRCGRRYKCHYRGKCNEKGLPHGRGVWSDNSYYGEILTGMWKEGSPVAPFHSRQYGGKGNTFGAIRIAYFLATDDTVNDTKFFPTNHEQPPRAGVISVECSIAGDFYSNLPQAELLGEPRIEGRTTTQQTTTRDGGGGGDRESIDIDIGDGDRDRDDSNGSGICSSRNSGMISIGDCCRQVDEFDTTDNGNDNDEEQQQRQDSPVQNLQISCNDSRGVQVIGHRYKRTGLPFTNHIKQIIIDVGNFDDNGSKVNSNTNDYYEPLQAIDGEEDDHTATIAIAAAPNTTTTSGSPTDNTGDNNVGGGTADSSKYTMRFNVRDWTTLHRKDTVLIFIPGFYSWLTKSAASFGQYPGASLLTFRWAELICATEQNQKHFLQMLKGLRQEGIQNVHFLTHSLGVEPLMNAFEESTDGTNSCAALFVTAPTSRPDASTTTYSNRNSMADVGKLVCRSITLMNPAFPLDAFRERGFRSLRKVTPLITIIGDTTDFALLIGALENGFCNWWGLPKPALLDSKTEQNQQGFHLQGQLGREIMSIYFDNNDDEDGMVFRRRSQKQQRVISSSSTNNNNKKKKAKKSDSSGEALALTGEDYLENKKKTKKNNKNRKKYWMDCDVINTTGLDTNVNDVRHSAFSMNSILIRDIEELIVQCKRARERSSLLHVEGNVYEYCHAPSYVKPE